MAARLRDILPAFLLLACRPGVAQLQTLPHQVLHDARTHVRNADDNHYNHWTQAPAKATGLLRDFGIILPGFQLQAGQILAVFLNDNIHEDLDRIVFHKAMGETFADYVSSGIQFKLQEPEKGKKYSHLTVVVFRPVIKPRHIGMRGMKTGGLSENR